jgi:hypothetical protein
MTTKKFWKAYLNEDIFDIFDMACDFFSKPLEDEDFWEEHDISEVIIEIVGQHDGAREYEKVIKFAKILEEHQPELYQEHIEYVRDLLLDYYNFKQDHERVSKVFSSFINDPTGDLQMYLIHFKKIVLYQQTDLIQQAISQNFAINPPKGSDYDFTTCKTYMVLQDLFEEGTGTFDKAAFLSKIADYDFKFNDDFLTYTAIGIFNPMLTLDSLKSLFEENSLHCAMVIKGYFLREMHKKGFAFYLSSIIWNYIIAHREEAKPSKKTFESYFSLDHTVFFKHVEKMLLSSLTNGSSEVFSMVWGSVYVIEFLYKNEIISEQNFLNALEVIKKAKGKLIHHYIIDLWSYNFIHSWQKPDCVSETEFSEEHKIFQKSITFRADRFYEVKREISEELSKIGELSSYILEGEKDYSMVTGSNLLDKMLLAGLQEKNKKPNLNRVEPKVGRNDPCPCGSGKKYKKCCG